MSSTEISSKSPPSAVQRNVLVFGAGGLIGQAVTSDLRARGFRVTAIARRFAHGARGAHDLQIGALGITVEALGGIISEHAADVVVNCLGVLQDGPGASTHDVHLGFVQRLIDAIRLSGRNVLIIHLSVPGDDARDSTAFSKTKRAAERALTESGIAFAILRPGFVIAPAAFGGSALMRAFAALPFQLSEREASVRFMPVAVEDVAVTVALLAASETEPGDGVVWELMQTQPASLADVLAAFRRWLGAPRPWLPLPPLLLTLGAKLGDFAALLGWPAPVRSTALTELRRGVTGDPAAWIAATGIVPRALEDTLRAGAASIQDKWFARLYLTKALVIVSLVVFWMVSGLVALTLAFDAARFILLSHGFPAWLATLVTIVSSLVDIAIGILIAIRRTCFAGLAAGILVALGYMVGAAVLTPDLWIEPLGALVKTGPAIVLMIVALMTLDNR